MTLTPLRRWLLLAGALTLTLAAVQWLGTDGGGAPEALELGKRPVAGGGKSPAPQAEAGRRESTADLSLEKSARAPLPDEVKNIFASQSWFVPPPPPTKPVAPPLPFTYLGKMFDNGRVTVFLSRQNQNLAVKPGEVIDGMYRVDSINPPVMTFTYLPLNLQQSLEIGRAK